MTIDKHLDELDQSVDVVKAEVERSDADGEVDVWSSLDVVVDDLQHVVGRLTAFSNQRHSVRHGRQVSRQVTDVKRRRVPEIENKKLSYRRVSARRR